MQNTRILISAGPTADILVMELNKEGYIAYDVGHIPYREYYFMLKEQNDQKYISRI